MTFVFIENVLCSGQVITVSEACKGHVVFRRLEPGENMRIAVSRFQSISIEQAASARVARTDEGQGGGIAKSA
jgi:hypothetical protein